MRVSFFLVKAVGMQRKVVLARFFPFLRKLYYINSTKALALVLITKSSTVTLRILFLVFLGAFPCAMCTISAAEALVAPVPFSEEAPLAIADNEAFTPYVYFFWKRHFTCDSDFRR